MNLLILHLAIFLVSCAPLFAQSISLDSDVITWWRCLISFLVLSLFFIFTKNKIKNIKNYTYYIMISGAFLGLHWWTFFVSIQYSGVAIGVLSLYTYPLITTCLEPLYIKTKFNFRYILEGLLVIFGVFLLLPELSFENKTTLGILIGCLSALLYSCRAVITKKHLSSLPALKLLNYQLLFAFLILSFPVFFNVENILPKTNIDYLLLVLLSVFFTIGGHGFLVYSFKHFSASKIGILASLQVFYSALLAFIFLKESPDKSFFIGALIILSVNIYESYLHLKKDK